MSNAWYKTYIYATDWILEAGERIRVGMCDPLNVKEKSSRHDLVTNIDIETEKFLTEQIRTAYPDHRIFAEESQSAGRSAFSDLQGAVWIIDPIDGTLNFVKQRSEFGIMLALFVDGKPVLGYVYDVMQNALYSAISGEGVFLNGRRMAGIVPTTLAQSLILVEMGQIRRNEPQTLAAIAQALAARTVGSSAMVTCILARQRASAFIGGRQMPWDAAAPLVILRELGYHVSLCDGREPTLLGPEPILIAAPGVYESLVALHPSRQST